MIDIISYYYINKRPQPQAHGLLYSFNSILYVVPTIILPLNPRSKHDLKTHIMIFI